MTRNEGSSLEETIPKWKRRLIVVSEEIRSKWKRRLIVISAALLSIYVLSFIVGIALTHFLVDLWWFSSLDYGIYFWFRLLYRYFLIGAATVLFFLIFFLNFWVASRYLGVEAEAASKAQFSSRYQHLLHLFQTGSLLVYTPLSLILAVVIALPFHQEWEAALLFLFGPEVGIRDPVYNNDVNFYLFSYPFFQIIQSELLITLLILALSVALLYWVEHHIIPEQKKEWPMGAKIHLTSLFVLTALLLVWGHMLERYSLLYVDPHEPQFFGPGFTEIRYQLPLIWMSIALFLGITLCATVFVHARKGLKSLVVLGLLYGLAVGLRHVPGIPEVLDRFIVKPNPVRMEKQFIENNIKGTLAAYDLKEVREVEVTATYDLAQILRSEIRPSLHNIPVWDTDYLLEVYRQLQGLRPYYDFPSVDVARYEIKGRIEQVNLAAREVNVAKLPKEARNWENTHLRYTHGYGAVVTPAAQDAEGPLRWWLRDLNLRSEVGFRIEQPNIYYGLEELKYAIVPNKLTIPGIARFDPESSEGYTGRRGIPISSLFRKLIFAIYFEDEKLFFTPNIDMKRSGMLMRRNIVERIKTLTPYLSLDADPYIVLTPEKTYWIQDAYTTSPWYPVSKHSTFLFGGEPEAREFNYIRNSVKVVVDAYDGSVDYYIADPRDPIIQAYRRIYPGIFRDLDEMPSRLQAQLRYPRDIFSIQMQIYARYHQTDPALFYQQAETWDFAALKERVRPYYLTVNLAPCKEVQNFVLVGPMTPIGRANLSGLGIGGVLNEECVSAYPGQLVLYKFRKEVQVEGPAQISALIDQEPEIAQQMALWDLRGSRVQRGRIIILPVGDSVLYVQPVYLVTAAATKIPQLARVILSVGQHVAMETSLQKAFTKLESKLMARQPAAQPSVLEQAPLGIGNRLSAR